MQGSTLWFQQYPHIDYSMDGVKLQLVKEEKDLGVTVSECLYEVGEAMH